MAEKILLGTGICVGAIIIVVLLAVAFYQIGRIGYMLAGAAYVVVMASALLLIVMMVGGGVVGQSSNPPAWMGFSLGGGCTLWLFGTASELWRKSWSMEVAQMMDNS